METTYTFKEELKCQRKMRNYNVKDIERQKKIISAKIAKTNNNIPKRIILIMSKIQHYPFLIDTFF